MKALQSLISLALVVGCLFLVSTTQSCVTPEAAKEVLLFPPAQLAWPAVNADYQRGLDDGFSEGDLTSAARSSLRAQAVAMKAALQNKNPDELRGVPWTTTMRPWVDRGIEDQLGDGDIGPTAAGLLTEQADQFTATIVSLQGSN
tara:strand:- start:3887 stop:4321 length:435 start_codon:yes stop_codon:yes gene_type:complete